MSGKAITASQLEKAGACKDQVKLFRQRFGESVVPTLELAAECASLFNWDWAAYLLLSNFGRDDYDAALVPLRRICYNALHAIFTASTDETSMETYSAAMALVWRTYHRGQASAFVTAYLNDQESAEDS